mmetsp:Transcript_27221/g.33366  ORF Transcript_27221/g.33366 Transcript_27221/m.33366 type:complete len:212 (-) Transcript_27221:318-953(-)
MSAIKSKMARLFLATFAMLATSEAFQSINNAKLSTFRPPVVVLREAAENNSEANDFITQNYPGLVTLLLKNDAAWKAINESSGTGFTIFAPTSEAFDALGEKKLEQIQDPRNLETAEKMASFHVINEPVSADALFNSGGVNTLGGLIEIERSISGGIFGIGGKEDGGVTLNGAKVIRSKEVANGVVHEVDNLVSPSILWRFMDQLRIPGSQ